ncbi:MAG: type II secretion system F family protein [Acidobacteriaceae bacterium]
MILVFAFFIMLLLCFGVMAIFSDTSHSEKAVERRLISIASPKDGNSSSRSTAEQFLKVNPASKFGWLDAFLHKYRITNKLEAKIAQVNSTMSVSRLLLYSAGLAILGFVTAYLCVSIFALQILAACALGYIPFGVITFKHSRRIAAFNAGLPDAIDMMGRSMRAGHSMVASMNTIAEQSVEPVKTEFREVFRQQNFGLPLRDALMQMLDHVPSQDLKVLVTGILVQNETGGNLPEILDRTSAVIRERLRIQGEIRTHTAQGRMTGWILCSLPIVMLVMINLINPGYSNVLMNTALGHMLIYTGIALLVTGAMIIRYIIRGIEV